MNIKEAKRQRRLRRKEKIRKHILAMEDNNPLYSILMKFRKRRAFADMFETWKLKMYGKTKDPQGVSEGVGPSDVASSESERQE